MRQGREEKEGHNETETGGERGTRDWMRRPRELVTLVGFDEGGMYSSTMYATHKMAS